METFVKFCLIFLLLHNYSLFWKSINLTMSKNSKKAPTILPYSLTMRTQTHTLNTPKHAGCRKHEGRGHFRCTSQQTVQGEVTDTHRGRQGGLGGDAASPPHLSLGVLGNHGSSVSPCRSRLHANAGGSFQWRSDSPGDT